MKSNIFLVTIDALRSDYIYSKNEDLHPFISSLMKNSIVFKNVFSPSYATALSFKGMFTDLSPLERCPDLEDFEKYKIPKSTSFIAEEFKKMGYKTAGFTSNSFLTRIQGYDRGFDYFYDELGNGNSEGKNQTEKILDKLNDISPLEISHNNKFYRRVKAVFGDDVGYSTGLISKAIEYLKTDPEDGPYFIWVHLMELHSPYRISPKWFEEINEKYIPRWGMEKLRQKRQKYERVSEGMSERDMEKIKVLYRCGLRLLDSNVEEFYNFLKKHGYLNNGNFILTSDHGEYLGDYDLLTHPAYFYNTGLKVPLIIHRGRDTNYENNVISDMFSNLYLKNFLTQITEKNGLDKYIKDLPDYIISEGARDGDSIYMIQNGSYKLIWNYTKNEKTFFEIDDDGMEVSQNDIKSEHQSELETKLRKHIENIKDYEEKEKVNKLVKNLDI